jgi:predicted RNase H-like nuclease (RuvC/YqgF family)
VAEAARRIGITEKAVRERIKHGSIEWRPKGNSGREVMVTPEIEGDEPSREAPGIGPEVMALRVDVARLEERLASAEVRAKAEMEALRAQLATEVAARNAVIEELKAGLDHERARSEALAAELAEARKGWLERLLEAVRRR